MDLSCPLTILDLGTYWAQRPAFHRHQPRTTAQAPVSQDREPGPYSQVTRP
jgi:hypothetical protein